MCSYSTQYSSQLRRKEGVKAKARSRGPLELTLAALLAQTPSAFDGRRLTAVDRNIVGIDALPDRCAAQVKTLYLSKNSLRSLDGIQQFTSLKALSVADNQLGDLAVLGALRSAGIALEAANFEGNPIADLPNYRAHVLEQLGPSVQMLDNRPVGPEERAAAPSAVAHEATMLALMLSNACLVHKLGRAVQLVRLHCELRCAVLSGQCGSGLGPLHEGSAVADTSRLLQLWDHEGLLNKQERHAILLAIKREVGRRYKRMLLAGVKLDGSAKSWQQAFAQVMLAQQETVASLMRLLEEARVEAAGVLAPLLKPSSPMKLRAVRSEHEADCRVKKDREALITELRDACLALTEGTGESTPCNSAAQHEQRIRALHAALQASSPSPGVQQVQSQPRKQIQRDTSPESDLAPEGDWAIPATRPAASASAATSPAGSPTAAAVGRPKSALKKSGQSTSGLQNGRPGAGCAGSRNGCGSPSSRPGSAPAVHNEARKRSAIPKPTPAPSPVQQGLAAGQPALSAEEPVHWAVEGEGGEAFQGALGGESLQEPEEHRTDAPLPFKQRSQGAVTREPQHLPKPGFVQRPHSATATSYTATTIQRSARSLDEQLEHYAGSTAHAPAVLGSKKPCPSRPFPRPTSRPASAALQARSVAPASGPAGEARPASPSAWTANPLASKSEMTPSRRPSSPAMQNLVGMLAYEGEQKQIQVLENNVTDFEVTTSRLQEANAELADSLEQLHQHAQRLEARVEELEGQLEAQQQEFLSQAQQLKLEAATALQSKQEIEAEAVVLRLQQDSIRVQLAKHESDIQHREIELESLRWKVAQLEGRDPVSVTLTVSYEVELFAEQARSVTLEARCNQLAVELASMRAVHQRQEELRHACDLLGGKSCLRRVFNWWRDAAADQASLTRLGELAAAAHRSQVLKKWMARWRLALQRARALAGREQQRGQMLQVQAWAAWRQRCHELQLCRALEVAALLHRQAVVLRQILDAWRAHAAELRQVDLPANHPVLLKARQQQRRQHLSCAFQAWRGWLVNDIKPKLAKLSLVQGHFFMSSQRRAWLAWRQYLGHRRDQIALKAVATQHFLSKRLLLWRHFAAEEKGERTAALRGMLSNKVLLLRRAWKAWGQFLGMQYAGRAAMAAAVHHRRQVVLGSTWRCWQEWVQLTTDLKDQQRSRKLRAILASWRVAARAAEKRRTAANFYDNRQRLRWRQAIRVWRHVVVGKQLRLQRLVHAQEVLQRWRLGKAVALWRRGVLVSKLQRSLELVKQLQHAIEGVKMELEQKAAEVDSLESIKVTVVTQAQSLSLRVTSLDSELEAAEKKAAELQAALQQALDDCAAAAAARDAAVAAQEAAETKSEQACSERGAAVAARQEALAEREAAAASKDAALQLAEAAEVERAAAAEARLTAEQQAVVAASERDSLAVQAAEAAASVKKLRDEKAGLLEDLEKALAELQRLAEALDKQQEEGAKLKQLHEGALSDKKLADMEKHAALKQAERLAALCEDKERQCQQLEGTVTDLEAQLASLRLLDEELRHIASRSDQLHEENKAQRARLATLAASAEASEGDRSQLQASLDAMRAAEAKLLAAVEEQQKQRQELRATVESLHKAKQQAEEQLRLSQAAAEQACGDNQALSQVVARLQAEREDLVQAVERLARERQVLDAQVTNLRDQVQQGSVVLESCRQMLSDCLDGGQADHPVSKPVMELVGCVAAELREKDATIRALAQDNQDRCQKIQTLQAQVEQLANKAVIQGARRDPLAGQGSRPGSPTSGSASIPASPIQSSFATLRQSLTSAATPSLCVSSPALPLTTQDPTIPYFATTFSASAVADATPASSPSHMLQRPARSAAPSRLDYASVTVEMSRPASLASPRTSQDTMTSLAASTQKLTSLLGSSATPQISPAVNALAAAPFTQGNAFKANTGYSTGVQHNGQPSTQMPTLANAAELRHLLLRPLGCDGDSAACLPAEVSEERLGFLLELVVQKRISAAEAQQVIKSAGEGDARPLLRVLDGVKRKLQSSMGRSSSQLVDPQSLPTLPSPNAKQQQKQSLVRLGLPGLNSGSATANELAAVRRQIQLLQTSIQSGAP